MASSRYLADLRTVSEKRLSRMLPAIAGEYDVVIIDCQPDYNNLVLNAVNASDLVITPVLREVDSLNAAVFLGQKIALDTSKTENWYLTLNGYNKRFENAREGKQKEYLDVYRKTFPRMTVSETWYPWTAAMSEIKDYRKRLSLRVIPGCVCSPELYGAAVSLASFCMEQQLTIGGEVF